MFERVVHGIVFTGCFIGLVFALYMTCFAANSIDADGVGDHEYTEIFQNASDEDMEMLERVVYHEAGKCDDWRLRLAVVETVMNRCLAEQWPDSISEVCKQKNQFACRKIPASATDYELEGVSDAILMVVLEGRTVLPSTDYTYFAIGKQKEATDHIYLGDSRKWQHMWFGKGKET